MTKMGKTWVTLALNEVQAVQALVLGQSLRRVVTKWNTLVLTNRILSKSTSNALEAVFDGVFIPEGISRGERSKFRNLDIPDELYCRIFCWNLPLIKRCVFLEPDSIVMKNCDELLEGHGIFVGFDKENNKMDHSIFVCDPLWNTFQDLLEHCSPGNDVFNTLETYCGKEVNQLHQRYFATIDLEVLKTVDIDEACILRLPGIEPKLFNEITSETFLMNVFLHWMNIFNMDVKPLLNGPERAVLVTPADQKRLSLEPIAIVGMGCRLPGANTLEEFWSLLIEGKDGITSPPDHRLPPGIKSEMAKSFQAGFLKCRVDEFDGKFFGISPVELSFLDPQTRILLEVLWEALENVAIDPLSLKATNAGVFTGTWTQDYKELLNNRNNQPTEDYFRKYMGNSFGAAAGRLSFILGVTGPNIATESGCSSSMVAVDMACKSLRLGETSLALACGANLILHQYLKNDLDGICASDGHCKTFDASADGFGRAEGCGVLVLKKYSDAIKDGDRIHALIRGMGTAQEGISRSLGTPTVKCESDAMTMALKNAGVNPSEVHYVECHGTGTPVGDPMEIAAIAEAYSKDRKEPLIVGSVKTNIGHTESCSGITGIIKTVLTLQNEIIPPHLNFHKLNPEVNLDSVPARIPLSAVPWPRETGKIRYAGVSSFGITGTDAHAIIQEAPEVQPKNSLNLGLIRPQHILTISARTEPALEQLLIKYKEYMELTTPQASVENSAFTANIGRAHFGHRATIIGKTFSEMAKNIGKKAYATGKVVEEEQKICFLFTGQGSQYSGMGKSLYETSPEFRYHFSKCESILRKQFGISILPVLWGNEDTKNEICRTIYSQTSIFCIGYSLFKLWESWGVKPDYVLGHSLGEFAAATAAGILSLEDALTLVAHRSRLIENLPRGQMIVVKADVELVTQLLKKFQENDKNIWLDFAAVNSNEQTVLSGDTETVQSFAEFCINNRIKCIILEATHAFHSRHMNPILEEYRKITSEIKYQIPTCKFISGMDGRLADEIDAEYWVRHTRESVQFKEASKIAYAEGCRIFIEIGPQPLLSALTMVNSSEFQTQDSIACLPSLRKGAEEWKTILTSLSKLYVSGVNINWKNFDKFYGRKKVTLPTYPFQRKRHWFESKANAAGGFQMSGIQVHPLIACAIPNATPTSIYNAFIELDKTPYLRDHKIGDLVIFPAAGFLEMSMAAGYCTTQGLVNKFEHPSNPISFENLLIESPLQLLENEGCPIQITVKPNDSSGSQISVYRERSAEDGNRKWVRHITGNYFPFATDFEAENKIISSEDLSNVQNRILDEVDVERFYNNFETCGLKFGETFKPVKRFWKNVESGELIAEIQTPVDAAEYLCHPLLIDAMLQAFIANKFEPLDQLHVPIRIEKFIWLSKVDFNDAPTLYAHSFPKDDTKVPTSVVLYDSKGKALALMTGMEIVKTSIKSIISAVNSQNITLPPIYETRWKSLPGPTENRAEMCRIFGNEIVSSEVTAAMLLIAEISKSDMNLYLLSQYLCFLYVQKAFHNIGWKAVIGEVIRASEFCERFSIPEHFTRFVNRLFMILGEEGYLSGETNSIGQFTDWTVTSLLLNENQISEKLESTIKSLGIGTLDVFGGTEVTNICGEKLASVLLGKQSAVELLFNKNNPEDESTAEHFYRTALVTKISNSLERATFKELIRKYTAHLSKKSTGVLQILEVGAGTGYLTKIVLTILEELKCSYHYTYTDISAGFFLNAERIFEPYAKKMTYKILDLEKDPLQQGFAPNQFDMVLGVNVLHICKKIAKCIKTIRQLTVPGGLLYISETFKPIRELDLVFGLTEGYWLYEDIELRPNHCTLSVDKWKKLLLANGCGSVATFPIQDFGGLVVGRVSPTQPILSNKMQVTSKSWILFAEKTETTELFKVKLETAGRNVVMINKSTKYMKLKSNLYQICPYEKQDMSLALIDMIEDNCGLIEGILYLWGEDSQESDQKLICEPLLYLSQIIATGMFAPIPKLVIVTKGACQVDGDDLLTNPSAATVWGFARSLRNEMIALQCKTIDMDPSSADSIEQKVEEAFMEIWKVDGDHQVAFRKQSRMVPRCITVNQLNMASLTLPNSDRFSLALPASKSINDLRLIPSHAIKLKEDEVEVQIKVTSLNFKDVLVILKPIKEFESLNSVGIDFAGVVTAVGSNVKDRKVGDAVFGCNFNGGAMPSHTVMPSTALVSIPDHWTFAESATLPVVFATAYYCMVTVADLKANETVLIHAASGGVGLCAIQLARHLGANIIATAGNNRKRAYLKNLGIQNVFNSRDLEYENQILKLTEGRGVDMVLNCLTGPGFKEASLKVCAQGARFVEMSKIEVWEPEQVAEMRPDVKYSLVDLTYVPKSTWSMLLSKMHEFMETNILKPIPYTRFDLVHVREGLNYLQKAKHIGKVVIEMPSRNISNGTSEPTFNLFNDRSTYLITGGLGGIGFEVAKWMAASGAKHIVLVGRKRPNPKTFETIQSLNHSGLNVLTFQVDIGNFDQCQRLFHSLTRPVLGLPPLRGIMHAAGTLSDALISNQDWSKFESTFNPKVAGGWNLHILTKDYPLEHFIMFSSVVALLGNFGQTNHSSANSYLDALAFHRHSIGLPALTVNWGQWGEVGVAAEIKVNGFRPFSPKAGILALEKLMKSTKTQATVLGVDFDIIRKLFPRINTYVEEVVQTKGNSDSHSTAQAIDSKLFREEFDKAEEEEGKVTIVKKYVELVIRQILKLDPEDEMDPNQNLSETGLDSLMMVEMKNSLQALIGNNIVINNQELGNHQTIQLISVYITTLMVANSQKEKTA